LICEVSHIIGAGRPGTGRGEALTQPRDGAARDDVIELRHVSKHFAEFFAMLGPSGCRKTKLAGGEG
jgi:hypothetical protein